MRPSFFDNFQNSTLKTHENWSTHLSVELSAYQEQYFTVVDKKIEQLNLKLGEQEVLDCYMAGMSCHEIADFLDIDRITVWRRRNRIQVKYKTLFNLL